MTAPLHRQPVPIPPVDPCDLPGVGGVCEFGKDQLGEAVTGAASSAFDSVVKALVDSFGKALQWCLTWWIRLPSPELDNMSALERVREYTTGLQLLLLTGAIMFTAARLATARRGGLAGATQEAFVGFARTVFGSWMYASFVVAGTRAGDAFSDWVITDATGGDAANLLNRMLSFDSLQAKGLGTGALFLISILGLLSALFQLVLLVVRQALLIVAAAAVPVAAAAAGTGPGSQSYQRLLGWSLAFVLFKPVGALVYAVAFSAAGTTSDDPQQVLLGLILLTLVAFVAPALMRMIAPAVAAVGGGGSGGAALLGGGLALAAQTAMQRGGSNDNARPVSEADHTGGGSGGGAGRSGGGTGGDPSGGGGGTGGGAGRSMPGTGSDPSGTSGGATASSGGGTGSAGGGDKGGGSGFASGGRRDTPSVAGGHSAGSGTAGAAGTGAAAGSAAGGAGAAGGTSAGAAGGPVGMAVAAGLGAASAAGSQVRAAVAAGTEPEPSPYEVPR